MKKIINILFTLLMSIGLGYLLLFFVYLLPVEPMQENVKRSGQIYISEQQYQRVIPGYISTQLDNYTDTWMLGNAIFKNDTAKWKQALTCTRAEYGNGPKDSIERYINRDFQYEKENYSRYWHGYLIILKPLLLIFSYADIRFLNIILESILVLLVCNELNKRGYKKQIIAYFISLLFVMPVVIPLSIQFSVIFYISNLGMIFLLKRYEWLNEKGYTYLFFLITGVMTSYFDLLTYPIATLGMSLTCLVILEYNLHIREKIQKIIAYSVSWGAGYAGMWAGKWILATFLLKENVLQNAISQIAFRTATNQDRESISVFEVWFRNIEFYFERPYLIVVLGCIFGSIAILIIRKISLKQLFESGIPFIVIAFMPFMWYILARQHSYEHHWFTFRGLMVTVFACLNIIIQVYDEKRKGEAV